MKFRLARLGVLLASVVALVGGVAQPASAAEVGVIVVQGRADVGQGIAYPCLDGKTTPPTTNTSKCLGFLAPSPNPAPVTFTGSGAGVLVKVAKPKCPGVCVEAGTFSITATGGIRGACGLSAGLLTGRMSPTGSFGTKPAKVRDFTVNYTGIGGALVIQGSTSKGERLAGVVVAAPTTGTCLNKTPKVFTVAGPIVVCGNIPGC